MSRQCAVCGRAISDAETWMHHQRLNADICGTCPLTDVRGEDVTGHTLLWHFSTEPACPLCRCVGWHAPTCLETLANDIETAGRSDG